MKKHNGMRPQDVVIILKLISQENKQFKATGSDLLENYTNKELARSLEISESEVSESLRRSEYAGLISDIKTRKINKKSFLDFLTFGLKYTFPAKPGAMTRGILTAHSAMPLKKSIISNENYVWEHPEGTQRGQSIEPLYPTIPKIAEKDANFYALLVLTDAIRTGSGRIFSLATKELETRILN